MTATARREQARDDEDLEESAVDDLDNMSPEELAKLDAAIDEGLAQLDAGLGIPHERVMREFEARRRATAAAR
jgi:predicted transcriptional regulator